MMNLRNIALALYAISSILASTVAIHNQVARYMRRKQYSHNTYSDYMRFRESSPIHMSYDEWMAEYNQRDAEHDDRTTYYPQRNKRRDH